MTIPGMNHWIGTSTAKMYKDESIKVIPCHIHPNSFIGLHGHETGDDINYVLSGHGKAICDGVGEILVPGVCHICRKGSSHSIENTGDEDLILLTIVVEK